MQKRANPTRIRFHETSFGLEGATVAPIILSIFEQVPLVAAPSIIHL